MGGTDSSGGGGLDLPGQGLGRPAGRLPALQAAGAGHLSPRVQPHGELSAPRRGWRRGRVVRVCSEKCSKRDAETFSEAMQASLGQGVRAAASALAAAVIVFGAFPVDAALALPKPGSGRDGCKEAVERM